MAEAGRDPVTRIARLRGVGAEALRLRPVTELIRVLGGAGARFLDRSDPLRVEAEARMPEEAGVSPEMARAIIEGMARDWTADRLETLVRSEFADPEVLDGPRPGPGGDRWMAMGDRFAFHIASGSVPGVGATSMLRSLLVKTPLLLKPGRGDRTLPQLLARAIGEADRELAAALEVIYWPGGAGGALEEAALDWAERVVVYGGNDTVAEIHRRVRPGIPVVAYPHRVSVGMVGRTALVEHGDVLADSAAGAAAYFDQRGCVSPHMIWVEGDPELVRGWAEGVARASERWAASLPPGPMEPDEAGRIQQRRASLELRAAVAAEERGAADCRVWAGKSLAWTVALDPDPAFTPSCLGRTLLIKPIEALTDVVGILAEHSRVLQSVALEVETGRRDPLAAELARVGCTRITTFARQPWPPAWWKHDGRGPLEVLVRRVSLEE
ncbi:MAG: hypothetical protein EA351_12095 [Gemmatimonadales bacterium]|nr:MAG: hypothetical protein EA351_12095 [Gemmatimonadales bacterium]